MLPGHPLITSHTDFICLYFLGISIPPLLRLYGPLTLPERTLTTPMFLTTVLNPTSPSVPWSLILEVTYFSSPPLCHPCFLCHIGSVCLGFPVSKTSFSPCYQTTTVSFPSFCGWNVPMNLIPFILSETTGTLFTKVFWWRKVLPLLLLQCSPPTLYLCKIPPSLPLEPASPHLSLHTLTLETTVTYYPTTLEKVPTPFASKHVTLNRTTGECPQNQDHQTLVSGRVHRVPPSRGPCGTYLQKDDLGTGASGGCVRSKRGKTRTGGHEEVHSTRMDDHYGLNQSRQKLRTVLTVRKTL